MARRLYAVVRRDLSPAQRAVQAAHAVAVYAGAHPTDYRHTTLVLVLANNEEQLHDLSAKAFLRGVHCEGFVEPDIGGQLTALCIDGSDDGRRLCSRLPLLT